MIISSSVTKSGVLREERDLLSSSMMIDASSSNGKVVRREYKTTYWKKHFYCGRRPW